MVLDRTDGPDGRTGQMRQTDGIQFHSSIETEKHSVQFYRDGEIQCTILQRRGNKVLQLYRDPESLQEKHVCQMIKIPYIET